MPPAFEGGVALPVLKKKLAKTKARGEMRFLATAAKALSYVERLTCRM